MKKAFISIDLGTTRLKVTAFSPNGKLLRQVHKRHSQFNDGEKSWQDANEWWSDVGNCCSELVHSQDYRVLGLSLSGRGGAGVFLDEKGEVLAHPWSDNRHSEQHRQLILWRESGHFLPNYGAHLIAKLRWLNETHPEYANRIRYACYAKDFLLFRLTGKHITDWSSGPDREYWDHAIPKDERSKLPKPGLPWDLAGTLTRAAAKHLGLAAGTPVAVGAHDGVCANVGASALETGEFAITLGTHAVTRTITNEIPEGAYRFYGLPKNRHVIGGNALMGGRSVDWLLDLISPSQDDKTALYNNMEKHAQAVPIASQGLVFMPFLSGQVAPKKRPRASGGFHGIRTFHGQGQLYRSILEGVAYSIKDIFLQIEDWCGPAHYICLTGGGSSSVLWQQILANILNKPLEISDTGVEGRGAAVFLSAALSGHGNFADVARNMRQISHTVLPKPDDSEAYDREYKRWKTISEQMAEMND
jgi:xylulokinase